jgi:SAM-dependent methyltransferase
MAQITHGIRSVLSHPLIYSAFQSLMGAHKGRQRFVANYIKPTPAMKVLDIGCGPAEILAHLPSVDYYGFDISKQYIEKASHNFSSRGTFFCKIFDELDLKLLPKFDVILAIGLLHHLDDEEAVKLIELASKALKPGGRLLTVDPCFVSGQNFIARFLINNDRGQNVRNKEEYLHLVNRRFNLFNADVTHQTWIPYTNCFMTCIKE